MLLPLLALLPFSFLSTTGAPPVTAKDFHAPLQGIYLTSQTIANPHGEELIAELTKLGGNMIVFDIQDGAGRLAYPSKLETSLKIGNHKDQIKDLAATVKNLHEKGMYAVARFVLFKNTFLAKAKPGWRLKQKGGGRPFSNRDGPVWLDPGNPELAKYLIEIGRELAEAGVDEIQFDYVRFPEGGKGGYIGYSFTGEDKYSREDALVNFISEAAWQLHYYGVKIGLDIFGIVVWDNVSKKIIGQNISELAKYVDVLYPMPYPSHFGPGWGGHKNPADEPYFFVQETTKKFVEQTAGTGVKIRPWLQGFAMRVSQYGPQYIKEQIRALTDIGIFEFVSWNASNSYTTTFGGFR